MIRLLFLVIFGIICEVCAAQRFYGLPRAFSIAPTPKCTITPIRSSVPVAHPIAEDFEMIQLAKVLNQLQINPVKDYECGCFTSEIISKLIDALVISTTQQAGNYEKGSLLNVALGDTDLLGVSI